MTVRDNDMLFGAFVVAIFLPVYIWVIPAEVPVLTPVKVAALSPDFWPRIIVMGLVLLGLIQMGVAFAHPAGDTLPRLQTTDRVRTACLCLLLVAFPLVVPVLGFLCASVLIMGLCMGLFGERRIAMILGCSVALALTLQLFFVRVAAVLIPTGLLPF